MGRFTRGKLSGRVIAALCGLSLVATSAACGASNDAGSDTTPSISFMLDWTPNTNHVGVYAAQALGYYKDAGINVNVLPTAQAGAETSVENGVADVGFTTLSNVAAFNAQGASLRYVFDLTQKPVARWCALASRSDIRTPKDFDGKTFVSFGSAEQTAVIRQMIKSAGGKGDFQTATAGTSTFQTLSSGKGDFGGFYVTWENVESKLNGPALNCFVASDWGVPGNPDQLGFAVNSSWLKDAKNKKTLQTFITATIKGYDYALSHPDEAATLLVKQAKEANLDPKLAKSSMEEIVKGGYWTGEANKTSLTGKLNMAQGQSYLDFQYQAGTYKDSDNKNAQTAPQASSLATNAYVEH
ncbi:ABC transporter substrate-binding protein [Bifidobacterium psychraerophilum]|nr:ABC transporter substrate-binding protein [Bifidobacterium psychraerophilum]MCI1659840.1 ABC transporter substrate-binding protein [Bifidobacterium psychraerophilum]MCI1805256.1 ABC transporter substrate-binding protein [Bifidobacterium psychraerophilum]MCI2177247.1 ABC transporter substrate-binding protein [Bifidobacterium psychraerophilum]MCI2182398.1 ABC transporter substrate-binding protein [Bifidobacterium psychraerophilum]